MELPNVFWKQIYKGHGQSWCFTKSWKTMKPSGGLLLLLLGLLAVCAVMPAASGNGNQKPGRCPVAPPGTITNCDKLCKEDVHCLGPKKCCKWGCSRICLDPVKG